ncbi:MAG: hypothetical protein Q4D85_12505 [Corynebacterium sp.]|uniref:hypothetical protein n=1 Tax=Corynebacterium sp. TaxID=1720 RepID=UPI0026DAB6B9|nr:hypothetical protein [Corynebacterium sp.]MDO5099554.1 hypothetical protein [Corynebacterium sp.]
MRFVSELKLSLLQAFLGEICTKIRAIIFSDDPNVLRLKVIVESPLAWEEKEAISVAMTEVLCDFPQFETENLEIICDTKRLSLQLPPGEHFFYLRWEGYFDE